MRKISHFLLDFSLFRSIQFPSFSFLIILSSFYCYFFELKMDFLYYYVSSDFSSFSQHNTNHILVLILLYISYSIKKKNNIEKWQNTPFIKEEKKQIENFFLFCFSAFLLSFLTLFKIIYILYILNFPTLPLLPGKTITHFITKWKSINFILFLLLLFLLLLQQLEFSFFSSRN